MAKPKVTLVGGGLAGALLAIYLGRRGYQVTVYERRPDIREQKLVRGRSINLAISTRGLKALEEVGLKEKVLSMCVPMQGRLMHDTDRQTTFQPYGIENSQVIHSVPRGELNKLLLRETEKLDTVELKFGMRCLDVEVENGTTWFEDIDTGETFEVGADFVIGADGAFSAVRQRLMKRDGFSFSQDYLDYGYKEVHFPPADDGSFAMRKDVLHIWPRQSFMMIALPNNDGSFTGTLFWPLKGNHGFDQLRTESEVRDYFERWFPDAVPLIENLERGYLKTPASSLVTIRCSPWVVEDKVVLIGDACHAVVPFYGQGMNAGFEDCRVLAECLDESPEDLSTAFREYHSRRKENADALADLALENFVEMRDHVSSPIFLLKKKLGKWLHRCFPLWFVPLYTMVTFTNIPYARARERSRKQNLAVGWVLSGISLVLLVALVWGFR